MTKEYKVFFQDSDNEVSILSWDSYALAKRELAFQNDVGNHGLTIRSREAIPWIETTGVGCYE